ncbi:Ferric reductase transmembrane component 5 [Termitomyces sp. T112]|nr:Ferric reductase transmembrane component 5 [Termitomyces sp. T112]
MPSSRTITPVTPSLSSPRAENLVFHVTLFLLSVIGFFVLLRLPRAFARFWRPSEWLTGHIFWHTSFRPQRARGVYAKNLAGNYSSETGSTSETKQAASDDSHTLYVHDKNNKGQQQVQTEFNLPPHIATCPAFLQRLVMLHRVRISPGFSVSQAVIMICYFATLIYAGCYKSSPFSDPVRAGWVAVSQLPIVIALATKNNIIGTLMGFTYEKLNYLHRFIGQLVVIAANIHSLGYFYKWSIGGTFQASISTPHIIWGLVGLVALDCIFFFSLSFWRNRYHNIMLPVHIIGLVIAIPAIWMHKPSTMRWMCACIGIYGFDHVCRFIKTRISTATIRPLPEMNSTRVEVPYINGGWRAGQHVRLRVLTFGLGWFGWTEAHPFTIASVADGEEGIILLVKKSGRWTGRLYDMAKSSGFTEAGQGRRVKVMVEGPYGGPCHSIFASYSAAVFIVGGSGITFALSAIQDLIREDLGGRSRVKSITLIWSIQDPSALHPLLPRLMSMIQESVYTPIHISVHYTRVSANGTKPRPPVAHPQLMLSSGRPQILKSLQAALARAVSLVEDARDERRVSGMLVGVCGPVGLGDDVSKAVATVDPSRRDQVGGIEIHEEVFGL